MKKLFFYAAVVAMALSACAKDPEAAVSFDGEDTIEAPAAGTSVTIKLKANYAWTATIDGTVKVTVDPSQGNGDADVAITVAANETDKPLEGKVTFSATGGGTTASKVINITQAAAPAISVDKDSIEEIPVAGEEYKVSVTSNYAWTAASTGTTSVIINPESGDAGTTEVTITVAENKGKEPATGKVVFTADGGGTSATAEVALAQLAELTEVEWGGVTYSVKKMKDGNYWFTENLRYIPDGFTPSNSLTAVTAGVFYPIVVNSGQSAAEFSTDENVIKAKGYLYQAEVALGLKVGDIQTVAQAQALEGTRGICPEGWHVPTINEIVGLVGKAVSPITTNTEAPYYNGTNGSISLLNADGFNMDAFGAISIVDNTRASGTFMGWATGFKTKISSGMIHGSSYVGVTYNTANDESSGIKNVQFWGFMPMTNKAAEADYTCNGTKVSYRIAAPVRCVKDH